MEIVIPVIILVVLFATLYRIRVYRKWKAKQKPNRRHSMCVEHDYEYTDATDHRGEGWHCKNCGAPF